MLKTNAQRLFALPLAFMLLLAVTVMAFCGLAYAEGEGPDTTAEPNDLQIRVQESAAAYDEAVAHVEDLQRRIDENHAFIAQVEADLPLQQEKADAAMVSMYKMSDRGYTIADMLMGAGNIGDFINACDFLNIITTVNMDEVAKLKSMQAELSSAQAELEAELEEAEKARVRAEESLAEAQAARQEAMAAFAASLSDNDVDALRQQAVDALVEEAAAAAAEEGLSEEDAAAQVEAARESAEAAVAEADVAALAASGVDWSMSKDDFVNEWTGRIDSYLEGSPLEGQGSTFATAAWENGVDPRWSPAIANTESTKGQYCFAEHNAWGWGSSSWDSWEEAINEHVEGLAAGYGSTITEEGAAKYCPPNADFWYTSTVDQMNQI